MKTGTAVIVSGIVIAAFFIWYVHAQMSDLEQMSNLEWVLVLFIDMVIFSLPVLLSLLF